MKILLIHSAEPLVISKIEEWRKKSGYRGEFYQLSLLNLAEEILSDDGSMFIQAQIKKARSLYGIDEIIILLEQANEAVNTEVKEWSKVKILKL